MVGYTAYPSCTNEMYDYVLLRGQKHFSLVVREALHERF